jgi:ketosteroid isomerase-like protein
VQTADASRELSTVNRALIATRLGAMLDMCARGDAAGVGKYFTEDAVYAGGTWRIYPLVARREGRAACVEMLRAFYVAYESLGSTIEELLVDGDCVAVLRTTKLRNRGTGKFADIRICNFLRMRDGLVAEYSEFPDTAAAASLDGP